MFSVLKRARPILIASSRGSQTRFFSPLAIYSQFPATLHYYRPKIESSLFDRREIDNRPHDLPADGVEIAADGLVYPKATRYVSSESNGATLLPNTFTMQEIIRNYYDAFLDLEEAEQTDPNIDLPQIYTIPKGTSPRMRLHNRNI
ncbi:hypothetical protein A9K55_006878 [Cordyceps militaris]|uniref:Tse2 ADP-ribosyltransferase toxin domain-containing protein n=1 Tax=Cordyceps militaris TaxID=73501 RepID=A0A2H4SAX8_CORMI|nr:hypothetical protein A9K55_006878 [Cordyceps militaris]